MHRVPVDLGTDKSFKAYFACGAGTFMFDSESERKKYATNERTRSLWSFVNVPVGVVPHPFRLA